MKLTLLELVQNMLTAIDSENVTDVGETEEAGMCVNIANRCFEEMASKKRWRHFKSYRQLSTTANKNELSLPSGTYAFDPKNVYYSGLRVYYMSAEDFLAYTIARNTTDSTITTINNIKVVNNRDPQFFTSDDDEILRFDSVPNITDGLNGANTLCICYVMPVSRLTTNAQVFDLPHVAFSALNSLCLSTAVGELKGDSSGAATKLRDYKTSMASLSRNARIIDTIADARDVIVPRNSPTVSTLRNTGNGWV